MASDSAAAAAPAAAAASTAPVGVPRKRAAAELPDAIMAGDGGAALDPQLPQESLLESIKRLKEQQAAMKAAKKEVQRELRNATKRRQRLKKQARQLTDNLVEVLQMRKEAIPAVVVGEHTAAAAALRDADCEEVEMTG